MERYDLVGEFDYHIDIMSDGGFVAGYNNELITSFTATTEHNDITIECSIDGIDLIPL